MLVAIAINAWQWVMQFLLKWQLRSTLSVNALYSENTSLTLLVQVDMFAGKKYQAKDS
jgi:hypothetical protein